MEKSYGLSEKELGGSRIYKLKQSTAVMLEIG